MKLNQDKPDDREWWIIFNDWKDYHCEALAFSKKPNHGALFYLSEHVVPKSRLDAAENRIKELEQNLELLRDQK